MNATVPPEFPSLLNQLRQGFAGQELRKTLNEFVFSSRVGNPVIADENNINRTKNECKRKAAMPRLP